MWSSGCAFENLLCCQVFFKLETIAIANSYNQACFLWSKTVWKHSLSTFVSVRRVYARTWGQFSLGYTSDNWPDKCKFTLPTPPIQLNCNADSFPISRELFRLASTKVPQRHQGQKDYCLTAQCPKLSPNNRPFRPFLDTLCWHVTCKHDCPKLCCEAKRRVLISQDL